MVKVLVIDDEILLVKSTCMALDYYGFESKGVLSGEEGIQEVPIFKPDIILLDIMMPGIDGWQVLARLKEDEAVKDIPVIIYTAKEHLNGLTIAKEKGAVDYIAKPFAPKQLVAIIRKYSGE